MSEAQNVIIDDEDYIDGEERTIINLSGPQSDFFICEESYPLFVAGFGSGKSTTLALRVMADLEFPNARVAVYAPTYDLLRLVTRTYFEEYFEANGIVYDLNKSEWTFKLGNNNQIIMRSMDNPARIIGYQVIRSHLDELDTLPMEKAQEVWNKAAARNRQKIRNPITNELVKNRMCAYTTPEGFQFCWSRWVKNPAEGYVRFHAATASNPALPQDYIDNLRATYAGSPLIEAYLEGKFVNLTSGTVYYYDIEAHNTDREWDGKEPIFVGQDFNVNNMSSIIFVRDVEDGKTILSAVDCFQKLKDTPDVVAALKEKFCGAGKLSPNQITIWPDASGDNKSSKAASESDLTILKAAGFRIQANKKNPYIKDRVISVNSALANRTLRINKTTCDPLATSLQQQVYDSSGKPEKHSGNNIDDLNDACGYGVFQMMPVIRRGAHTVKTIGF